MVNWNDTESLTKLARWVPYLSIALGFIIAWGGQYAKTRIDARVMFLREREEVTRKNTPPSMDVKLGLSENTGKLMLEISANNEIPFRASWLVATNRDQLVSGILIEKPEIFPTEERRRFIYPVTINDDKVVDNYMELRFSFESLYSAELNHPKSLGGEIRKMYRYVGGQIFPWDSNPPTR